jgi:hypothetical protein
LLSHHFLTAAVPISLLLCSIGLEAPAAAQQVEVGNAATVVGDVMLDNDQLRRPIKVERRRRIAWGDIIATERNSQLQILLLDRSSFGIGQRSRVRIDRYVYDPGKERSVLATLLKGALRFFSGVEKGQRSGEISSPAGRIGIRGTAVDMLVGETAKEIAEKEEFVGRVRSVKNEATLVVLRGPGANARSGIATGLVEVTGADVTVVLDEPGLAAFIPRFGAAPIGPFRISDTGLAQVQDELAPRWARSFRRGGLPDEVIAGAAAVIGGILIGTLGGDDRDKRNSQTPPSDQTQNQNPDQAKPLCRDAQGRQISCPPRR